MGRKKRGSLKLLELDESDFDEVSKSLPNLVGFLGKDEEKTREIIVKLLPSVIAKKVTGVVPEEFELNELHLGGELAGQPWGIGIKGNVNLVFKKKSA